MYTNSYKCANKNYTYINETSKHIIKFKLIVSIYFGLISKMKISVQLNIYFYLYYTNLLRTYFQMCVIFYFLSVSTNASKLSFKSMKDLVGNIHLKIQK